MRKKVWRIIFESEEDFDWYSLYECEDAEDDWGVFRGTYDTKEEAVARVPVGVDIEVSWIS